MLSLVIHAWAIKVVILQKMHICGSNFNVRIQGDKFLIKSSLKPIGQRSCNLNQCSFTFYVHFLSSNYDLYGYNQDTIEGRIFKILCRENPYKSFFWKTI